MILEVANRLAVPVCTALAYYEVIFKSLLRTINVTDVLDH